MLCNDIFALVYEKTMDACQREVIVFFSVGEIQEIHKRPP